MNVLLRASPETSPKSSTLKSFEDVGPVPFPPPPSVARYFLNSGGAPVSLITGAAMGSNSLPRADPLSCPQGPFPLTSRLLKPPAKAQNISREPGQPRLGPPIASSVSCPSLFNGTGFNKCTLIVTWTRVVTPFLPEVKNPHPTSRPWANPPRGQVPCPVIALTETGRFN